MQFFSLLLAVLFLVVLGMVVVSGLLLFSFFESRPNDSPQEAKEFGRQGYHCPE